LVDLIRGIISLFFAHVGLPRAAHGAAADQQEPLEECRILVQIPLEYNLAHFAEHVCRRERVHVATGFHQCFGLNWLPTRCIFPERRSTRAPQSPAARTIPLRRRATHRPAPREADRQPDARTAQRHPSLPGTAAAKSPQFSWRAPAWSSSCPREIRPCKLLHVC